MALVKRGEFRYGDDASDIPAELIRYSSKNYPAEHFAAAVCLCGGTTFRLLLDERAGAALRACTGCGHNHPIGDSATYLDDAILGRCECACGADTLELAAGVALYDDSVDVRWVYLGGRCLSCGLTACFGDWKADGGDYREWLRQV